MLLIQDLTIKTAQEKSENDKESKIILEKFNLQIDSGIVGISGQNGAGKSTLAKVLAGIGDFEISGKIMWQNVDLLEKNIVQRAELGVFLSFQNPPIIKGISTLNLLKAAMETKLERENLEESLQIELTNSDKNDDEIQLLENTEKIQLNSQNHSQNQLQNSSQSSNSNGFNSPKIVNSNAKKILNCIKENAQKIQIGNLYRERIENLSGGERKKMEILQLLCLNPSLVILDEVDSGLDAVSVILIAKNLVEFSQTKIKGKLPILIVISHNPEFLKLLNCQKIQKIQKTEN